MSQEYPLIIEGRLLLPDGLVETGRVVVNSGGSIETVASGLSTDDVRGHVFRLKNGSTVVPGYIDVQVNGGFGEEVKSNPRAVATLQANLPRYGVTSFLPTVTSLPLDAYAAVFANIRESLRTGKVAEVLGVHVEGPFLNPAMRGGHPAEYLAVPSAVDESELLDPLVRMVTIAPELDGALALLDRVVARKLVAGVGHSTADETVLNLARSHGLRWGTHIFNAMNPLKGREPGLAGYLLTSDMIVGLIVDGIHVHPSMVRLVCRLKGQRGVILMTDSSAVTGLAPGTYTFRSRQISTDGKSARLPDGTLVGSVLTLDQAVRNVVTFTGCSLAEACYMASGGPAALLGVGDQKGAIAPGMDADLTILNERLEVTGALVKGDWAYGPGV